MYVRKGTWELHWQAPLESIGNVSQPVGSSQVVLESMQADGSSARRVVECMTHAVVPLVLDTVKRAIEVDDEAEALT